LHSALIKSSLIEPLVLTEARTLLETVGGLAYVLKVVKISISILELISELFHFTHLIVIKPIISPISLGVSFSPSAVKIVRIKIVVVSIIIFLNHYFLQHLLNSDSVVHDVASVKIPNNINDLVGCQKAISVVIVESKELLTLLIVNISLNV